MEREGLIQKADAAKKLPIIISSFHQKVLDHFKLMKSARHEERDPLPTCLLIPYPMPAHLRDKDAEYYKMQWTIDIIALDMRFLSRPGNRGMGQYAVKEHLSRIKLTSGGKNIMKELKQYKFLIWSYTASDDNIIYSDSSAI